MTKRPEAIGSGPFSMLASALMATGERGYGVHVTRSQPVSAT